MYKSDKCLTTLAKVQPGFDSFQIRGGAKPIFPKKSRTFRIFHTGKERIIYQANSPRGKEEDREHGFYGVLVWFDCKGII